MNAAKITLQIGKISKKLLKILYFLNLLHIYHKNYIFGEKAGK